MIKLCAWANPTFSTEGCVDSVCPLTVRNAQRNNILRRKHWTGSFGDLWGIAKKGHYKLGPSSYLSLALLILNILYIWGSQKISSREGAVDPKRTWIQIYDSRSRFCAHMLENDAAQQGTEQLLCLPSLKKKKKKVVSFRPFPQLPSHKVCGLTEELPMDIGRTWIRLWVSFLFKEVVISRQLISNTNGFRCSFPLFCLPLKIE